MWAVLKQKGATEERNARLASEIGGQTYTNFPNQ
jgi:hypothetical protein